MAESIVVESLENEEWKTVKGLDGYQVSNLGRIKSFRKRYEAILKQSTRDGYKVINLRVKNRDRHFYVHRLVYTAFMGEIPPQCFINHVDKCRSNNELSNLEVTTPSANQLHSNGCQWYRALAGEPQKNLKIKQWNGKGRKPGIWKRERDGRWHTAINGKQIPLSTNFDEAYKLYCAYVPNPKPRSIVVNLPCKNKHKQPRKNRFEPFTFIA